MAEEVRNSVTTYNYSYELPPLEKKFILFRIPPILRFALIWTIFFAIIGLLIQSIELYNASSYSFSQSFIDFFGKNYINWFKSFGNFTNTTLYSSGADLVYALLEKWYYFFYTGGLLALIWGLLSWIIHLEISFTKKQKLASTTTKQIQQTQTFQIPEQQAQMQLQKIKMQEELPQVPETYEANARIVSWLKVGLLLLSEGNLEEAELIYENIRREYDFSQDANQELYSRIKDFYEQILKSKSEKRE